MSTGCWGNIERVTGQSIDMHKVPTVADLRARRLDMTRATLRESILEDDLDAFRVVVETLSDEFDVMDVAIAAVKLAHEASGGPADEEDIPEVSMRPDHRERLRGKADGGPRGQKGRPGSKGSSGGMTRIFVGAGRTAGIRPQDLVGAIAGEANIAGREVGAIEIADRFSLVEVPTPVANRVVAALRASTIKGRKVTVRREHQPPG